MQYLMIDGQIAPFRSDEELIAREPDTPLTGRRRGPSMLYSSGTTGRPKGVRTPLPDEAPETPPRRLTMLVQQYGLCCETVLVNPRTVYHSAPGRFMMSVHRTGGTVVGSEVRCQIRASGNPGLPCYARSVCAYDVHQDVESAGGRARALRSFLATLRDSHGSAVPHSGQGTDDPLVGPVLEEMYSGTEAIGHTMITSPEWLAHKGSVGRAAAGCAIRVLDEAGNDLPPFTPGAIFMSNGNRFEYHKDPDKTRGAFTADGWATLGDIGYLDHDGYLYLTDRRRT